VATLGVTVPTVRSVYTAGLCVVRNVEPCLEVYAHQMVNGQPLLTVNVRALADARKEVRKATDIILILPFCKPDRLAYPASKGGLDKSLKRLNDSV